MREQIESGEYFKQAREWYSQLFLSPYFLRSAIFTFLVTAVVFLVILYFNIQMLFPMNRQIIYAINVQDSSNFAAKINSANRYGNDTLKSVAWIYLETYIRIRESYNYEDLADQMLFVKNTSTRSIYNRFASYLSLDNPESPVLKLQKFAKRNIVVNKIDIKNDNTAIVEFIATSSEENGTLISEEIWKAEVSFTIDQIDISLPADTPYKFIVSDYSSKFVKNLGKNKENDDKNN